MPSAMNNRTMMGEKDFSPLSPACVRALNDKLYEKRKAAALEIEKMVKDFVSVNNTVQIKKLLKVLGQDFVLSQNSNSRKGGLIGLAAMAIALGKDTCMYIDELVRPIMACFGDQDSRVRYYACEALYNVVKVARGSVLPYFNDVFDALSKLAADPDQNVKNGSELLDRLMKDIVTESSSFDLVAFMPLLRERIYTRNTFAKQFIVSWLSVLDAVPDIDMIVFLPEVLDGLFQVLEDPTTEIKKMCEMVLGEFLKSIIKNPQKVDFAAMVNILIVHSQSRENLVQLTAITWLKEFVQLAGKVLLPYGAGILAAVLPNLAHEDDTRRNIRDVAKAVNFSMMQLLTSDDDCNMDLAPFVEVLKAQIQHESMQTRVATLRWIYHLHLKVPGKIRHQVEELFPMLLKTLLDPSDEVVLLDLEVLAEISSSSSADSQSQSIYFSKFLVELLTLFSTNNHLLEERGSFIIRQLCLLLNAEDIYRTLADILCQQTNLAFASHMVQTLNAILLTSTELYDLRTRLRDLNTKESCDLFCCLYRCWCHSPIATLSLCFLTQNYKHACDLLQLFADLEVTVEFLTEVDKMVQLIESPIFVYLRLQLLDQNPYLLKSLYGLLMLLPQTDAFHTLHRRLACIPSLPPLEDSKRKVAGDGSLARPFVQRINFAELKQNFQEVQQRHKRSKEQLKMNDLSEIRQRGR